MSRADRFLKACRREPVDATPIWLMRQAGRFMAEYRELRARHSLLEMIEAPEIACEVTLQPVRAFEIDAAIIFADILPLLECIGLELEFIAGRGPVLHNPLSDPAAVAKLEASNAEATLGFTIDAVAMTQRELDGQVPLIGFSGAPFTLACYAFEGQSAKEFVKARRFMYEHPKAWHHLMGVLAGAVGDYLVAQIRAGAQAVQLFDSWAGSLSPYDYTEYVRPHSTGHRRTRQGGGRCAVHPLRHRDLRVPQLLRRARRRRRRRGLAHRARSRHGTRWATAWPCRATSIPFLLLGAVEQVQDRGRITSSRAWPDATGTSSTSAMACLKQTPVETVRALVDFVHARSAHAAERHERALDGHRRRRHHGLATAFYLERLAPREAACRARYTLLEAGDRLGGKLVTRASRRLRARRRARTRSSPRNRGACSFAATSASTTTLVPCSNANQKIYLLRKGRLVPFRAGSGSAYPPRSCPLSARASSAARQTADGHGTVHPRAPLERRRKRRRLHGPTPRARSVQLHCRPA